MTKSASRRRWADTTLAPVREPVVALRDERLSDAPRREALLDAVFGPARWRKTSQRLRDGRGAARGLSLVATLNGELVGTVRLWNVTVGGAPMLLLGPLAVAASHRSRGVGAALMREAIARATSLGHGAILLVGDAAYYGTFGFSAAPMANVVMPGPFERERLLGLALRPGALDDARGRVVASGAKIDSERRACAA